jgi:hypothetical protein
MWCSVWGRGGGLLTGSANACKMLCAGHIVSGSDMDEEAHIGGN